MKKGLILFIISIFCLPLGAIAEEQENEALNQYSYVLMDSSKLPKDSLNTLFVLAYHLELGRMGISKEQIEALGAQESQDTPFRSFVVGGLSGILYDKGTIGRHAFSVPLIKQASSLSASFESESVLTEKKIQIEKALADDDSYQKLLNQTVEYWVSFFRVDPTDSERVLAAKNAFHEVVVSSLLDSKKKFEWNPITILGQIRLSDQTKWTTDKKVLAARRSAQWLGIRDKGTIGKIMFKVTSDEDETPRVDVVIVNQAVFDQKTELARLKALIQTTKTLLSSKLLEDQLGDQIERTYEEAKKMMASLEANEQEVEKKTTKESEK